jgi:hypothetical protein
MHSETGKRDELSTVLKMEKKSINIKERVYQSKHTYLKMGTDTGNNVVKLKINRK